MPWGPKRRSRQWNEVDQRRATASERGYDSPWAEASLRYRREHPLCVHCRLRGFVRPTRAVDHIVPIACCESLKWEEDNWASLCTSCHSYKTTKDPRRPWIPDLERIVVCGLPGTGKSTWARERGAPYFDADELQLEGAANIIAKRARWMNEQRGACTVICASMVTAPLLAAALGGWVRHFTTVYRRGPKPGKKKLQPYYRDRKPPRDK